jgi:hypothetical protein
VEFAHLSEPSDLTVSYPASTQQREAKATARALFAERAGTLTAGLRELTGGAE